MILNDAWWKDFDRVKAIKAVVTLRTLFDVKSGEHLDIATLISMFVRLADENAKQIHKTRAKDYVQPYRNSVYRNENEKKAVLGTIDDDTFVTNSQEKMKKLITLASRFPC
jgi:hypothetical protein